LALATLLEKFKEDLDSDETIRTSLMGNTHSADVKVISNSGQSSIIAVLVNEALDVE